jgi:hypothetical protein
LRDRGRQSKEFTHAGLHDFSVVGEQGFANDFVLQVEVEFLVFNQVQQKIGGVASVHLAGVVRNAAGHVNGTDDSDVVGDDGFAGLRDLAVAAPLGGEIDNDRAGRHGFDHVFGDEDRRFFPGNDGGGDHDVAFLHDAAEEFALLAVKVFTLRGGIATGVLSVGSFDGELDETATQALDLLLGGGAHVIGGGDGAEAAGGGNGLESGDAAADHEDASRSDSAGGGGHHGEEARVGVGGDEDRFVSADGAHGGERVHALGAGGAGHELDGEGSYTASGEGLEGLARAEGAQEADQDLAFAQKREITISGDVIGSEGKDLEDDVGLRKDGRAVGRDFGTFVDEMGVEVAGMLAGVGLHQDFESGLGEGWDDERNEGDAPFVGIAFCGDTDDHRMVPRSDLISSRPIILPGGARGVEWRCHDGVC